MVRRWTSREEFRALGLIESGAAIATVAKRIRRSEYAIYSWLVRRGIRLTPGITQPYTSHALARLLGLERHYVVQWIKAGIIAGYKRSEGRTAPYIVTREALTAFIANEAMWPRWDATRISDADLREWALGLRQQEPFLTPHQVAARLCVQPNTVLQWLRAGRLTGSRFAGRWRISANALADFVPPYQRPASYTRRRFRANEDRRLRQLVAEGWTWRQIGNELGRGRSVVRVRARFLGVTQRPAATTAA